MVPMAGQDAVFDRAAMEWESKMRAAIIEGKHLPIVMNDEQRTASTANNDHSRGLLVNSSLICILDMWCSGFKD